MNNTINSPVPPSFPSVTFRIKGEHVLRQVDFRSTKLDLETQNNLCKRFVDIRCRSFVRLNGYNPQKKEWVSLEVIQGEVDHFFHDHPVVKS